MSYAIRPDLDRPAQPRRRLEAGERIERRPDRRRLSPGQRPTYFAVTNYPVGNYQFSYTGGGTVSFSGAGQLVGPVTVSGGVTTGTVAVTSRRTMRRTSTCR